MTAAKRLAGRRVTLAVTGSIAAYKAVIVARLLLREGARVRVVMTRGATQFVGPSTFSGITGEAAMTELFDEGVSGERHVALAGESDLLLVVPATADALARLAQGRADDLLAATVLCARCPVLAAPAMHPTMWTHPATARNVAALAGDGRVELIGPVHGEVASGEEGLGRMVEPEAIVERAVQRLTAGSLGGRHVVVTAGPTIEDIDPVRFVSNRSSGRMGFALAEEAARRGARVTLVAGPVSLPGPTGVARLDVRTALEMRAAIHGVLGPTLSRADALLMCAAVGDYRPERTLEKKLKRGTDRKLALGLVQNPDILAEIGQARRGPSPLLVGFAVETGTDAEITARARKKLVDKRVDVVVANHAAESMGRDDNRVLIVDRKGVTSPGVLPKTDVAGLVLDWVAERLPGGERARGRARARKPRR